MKVKPSVRFAALLGLANWAAGQEAVCQLPPFALAVKHTIDLQGWALLTDSFDSMDLARSNFGQSHPSVYTGDDGNVFAGGGITSSLVPANISIHRQLYLGTNGTISVGDQVAVGTHAWQATHTGFQPDYGVGTAQRPGRGS